jgi:hypothetical protein
MGAYSSGPLGGLDRAAGLVVRIHVYRETIVDIAREELVAQAGWCRPKLLLLAGEEFRLTSLGPNR